MNLVTIGNIISCSRIHIINITIIIIIILVASSFLEAVAKPFAALSSFTTFCYVMFVSICCLF